MLHEDLDVEITGPDSNYPSNMLSITSKGTFHLFADNARTRLNIHRLELDNLRLIRDTIDTFLAEHTPEIEKAHANAD